VIDTLFTGTTEAHAAPLRMMSPFCVRHRVNQEGLGFGLGSSGFVASHAE